MKLGILTFHRCINYGSYWQARCLLEGLRGTGHDAVILDHDSRRINLAEWKCAYRPMLPVAGPKADRPAYRRKMLRFFRAIEALPRSPRFPLDAPARVPRCDAVVVGSDEVWNLAHPWYGRWPLFFGQGLRTRRVLAYAASFGNCDPGARLPAEWARRLREFAAISVRDDVSRSIVADAIGSDVPVVLDPCLQFPSGVDTGQGDDPPTTPYIAVYGHGFSPAFAAALVRTARRRRLPLVSIGYRNDWADRQWIDAGPHEFARFMAAADAVATNFFHGCVFALRNARPFVCEASWYRRNKLQCLMATVGAQQRLLTEAAPAEMYGMLLAEPLDAAIATRIAQHRCSSQQFLDAALAPVDATPGRTARDRAALHDTASATPSQPA